MYFVLETISTRGYTIHLLKRNKKDNHHTTVPPFTVAIKGCVCVSHSISFKFSIVPDYIDGTNFPLSQRLNPEGIRSRYWSVLTDTTGNECTCVWSQEEGGALCGGLGLKAKYLIFSLHNWKKDKQIVVRIQELNRWLFSIPAASERSLRYSGLILRTCVNSKFLFLEVGVEVFTFSNIIMKIGHTSV